jgi:hypothetical protein
VWGERVRKARATKVMMTAAGEGGKSVFVEASGRLWKITRRSRRECEGRDGERRMRMRVRELEACVAVGRSDTRHIKQSHER